MSNLATTLSRAEARELTDRVVSGALELANTLQTLHDGKAHIALGYKSWVEYVKAEFGKSKSHAYRLLRAAETIRFSPTGGNTSTPEQNHFPQLGKIRSEGAARELARVEPDARQEVIDAATDGGKRPLTAPAIKSVLDAVPVKGSNGRKSEPQAEPKRGRPKAPKMTVEDVRAATKARARGETQAEPVDGDGNKIPPRLRQVFEQADQIAEAMAAIAHAKKLVKALREQPVGFFVPQSCETELQTAWGELKYASPRVCCYCRSKGKVAGGKECGACKGKGWCTWGVYRAAPAETREAFEPEELA